MCYTVTIGFSFTRMVTDYHGSFLYVPNYRIIEFFFSHGMSRNITDIYFLSRIIELSNFSFSHGVPRIITDVFLYPELSNYRIFLFTRMVTENHGYIFLVTNYRIIEFLFTRSSTENHGFIYLVMNSLIRKFGIKKIRDSP